MSDKIKMQPHPYHAYILGESYVVSTSNETFTGELLHVYEMELVIKTYGDIVIVGRSHIISATKIEQNIDELEILQTWLTECHRTIPAMVTDVGREYLDIFEEAFESAMMKIQKLNMINSVPELHEKKLNKKEVK